jgi:hypothetical protein
MEREKPKLSLSCRMGFVGLAARRTSNERLTEYDQKGGSEHM